MALDFSVKSAIERKIRDIEREYQQTQGLILTEDDLKCVVFERLSQIPNLSERVETEDREISATYVHAEVSWYDVNGHLAIKPDITILDPKRLSILHAYGFNLRLPSKQFHFVGKAIVIELKFVRNKTGIRQSTINGPIMRDYKKIQKLFAKLDAQGRPNDLFCYFVIFNKTDIKCKEFDTFIRQYGQSHKHKIIYATGNVVFSKNLNRCKQSNRQG